MKVVFIGSAIQNLSIAQELFQITERMQVLPLVGGEVSLENIARRTAGNRARILHIADHGDEQGIHLANGETLTKERLSHIARQLRVDIVFLNACTSAYLGQFLVDNGVPAVVAYTVTVFDSDAFRIATYYYEELEEHKSDFKRAYDHASPKDGTFAWFSDGKYTEGLLRPLLEKLAQLTKQLEDLRRQFQDKERRLLIAAGGVLGFIVVLNVVFWALFVRSSLVSAQTIPPDPNEKITICHNKTSTTIISRSAWPPHERHGDTVGPCPNQTIPTFEPTVTWTPESIQTLSPVPTVTLTTTPVPTILKPTATWTPFLVPTSTNTLIPTETKKPEPTSTNIPTQTPTIFVVLFTSTPTPVPTKLSEELQSIVNDYLRTYGCTCSQQ